MAALFKAAPMTLTGAAQLSKNLQSFASMISQVSVLTP
jgi:hypothetical protein